MERLGMSILLLGLSFDTHYIFRSLTGEQVNSKRLLSSWTLHFAAKVSDGA